KSAPASEACFSAYLTRALIRRPPRRHVTNWADTSKTVSPSIPPARCEDRQHHANEYDQGGNLDPDEAAEFSQNDFDTIAPWRRQSVANSFDAARCGSQRPFDPIRPVVKSNSDENPRQAGGDEPETVHLRVM